MCFSKGISSKSRTFTCKGQANCPIVLGHRGAAGIFPEHTTLAYEKGADFGADYIECDVQITKVSNLEIFSSHLMRSRLLIFSNFLSQF